MMRRKRVCAPCVLFLVLFFIVGWARGDGASTAKKAACPSARLCAQPTVRPSVHRYVSQSGYVLLLVGVLASRLKSLLLLTLTVALSLLACLEQEGEKAEKRGKRSNTLFLFSAFGSKKTEEKKRGEDKERSEKGKKRGEEKREAPRRQRS